ncbi:MAG: AarF/ABC1/UbiB kinase family protein [Anaerolineaceae bacterium]|nr:AarF/ABC1/UbiB kinase family protein [Anaerolineaceae bacterium]
MCMLRRRYNRILLFFIWVILGITWWDIILPRLGFRKISLSTRRNRMKMAAQRFRKLAVQMGGVMIKVGQFLSSRLDVLPREITDELAGLQDEVASEPFAPIQALVEAEFGVPLNQKFLEFNPVPIASASIGQVYTAKLCAEEDGKDCPSVVVKVQRPRIEEIINIDLSAIRKVGGWIQKYRPISKHVNVPRLIGEFSQTLYEEIDYLHEGKNAEIFAENFKELPNVRVPGVIWSHTTKRVLTLEDVVGIKITDYAAIEKAGIDRSAVAIRLFDTYLKQIFEDGFFHADPHPGNLFVQAPADNADPGEWKLTFVDFGMTGTLSENTFKGIREVLFAVGTQDAHRLMQSYQQLEILLPGADLELLERASQHVFEQFWGKSTNQIMGMHAEEARNFIDEFGELMYEMPFQMPENLILLGRSVSILSGICTGLDPDFNIFARLTPYAGKLLESEDGGKLKTIWDEILKVLQLLIKLPGKTDALLSKMEQGRLEVKVPALTREIERLNRSQRKTVTSIVFAAFLLSGVQLYIAGEFMLAAGFGGAALLVLIWLLRVR